MCIILKGQDGVIEQARRQLEDLVSRILLGGWGEEGNASGR